MNRRKLFKTFLKLIENDSQVPSLQLNALDGQIKKQHKALFLQNEKSLIDPKTLKRIEALRIPKKIDPINEPEISFMNDDEISTAIEKATEYYSACVLIDKASIKIWVNSAVADEGLVIEGSKDIEGIPFDLLSRCINMPTNSQMNFLHHAALIACKHRIIIYLPEKIKLRKPVLIDIRGNHSGGFFPIHVLNLSASDAQGKELISMQSSGLKQSQSLNELIIHNVIGTNSRFEVVELQDFPKKNCDFIAHEQAVVFSRAEYRKFIIDSGSEKVIRALSAELIEDGSSANITGLYTATENQSFFFDTAQNHLASNTTSDLLFKGVLKGNTNTLWKGNIFVEEGTHSADGYQMNNNLLLDTSAHTESIPGLEILTDDVRCSHGVTLSNIDRDQLFYLKSRGIDEVSAVALITNGFFESTFSRLKSEFFIQEIRNKI